MSKNNKINPKNISTHPPQNQTDQEWLRNLWQNEWAGATMISKGRIHSIVDLGRGKMEALIAWDGLKPCGAAVFRIDEIDCELLSINALNIGVGIGTNLLQAVEEIAQQKQKQRIWLITSNDNLHALRFYQQHEYRITAVYPDAIDMARNRKTTIPLIGYDDIPIHDEIELQKTLL